jgi:hypothetical protein
MRQMGKLSEAFPCPIFEMFGTLVDVEVRHIAKNSGGEVWIWNAKEVAQHNGQAVQTK